jgi:hypothetical protein
METISKRAFVTLTGVVFIFTTVFLAGCPVMGRAETNQAASPETKPSENAADHRVLKKGESVERLLTVGDVHTYEMTLDADQYVSVVFEKQGIALVATLLGSDGRKIGLFGSSASRQGQEPITFVTNTAGVYRIEVRTFFPPSPPGRYTANIAELRSSSDQDKARLAGQSCEEKHWLDRDNNFLVDVVLNSVLHCISAVGGRLEGTHPQAADIVAGSSADLAYLVSRWHWGEFVSAAYQENLVGDFRMLASAAQEPDANRAFAVMKAVAEDLKIKAEHCRDSTRGLGKDVDFSVRTIRSGDGQEERGILVYYKLGIYEFTNDSKVIGRFLKLSSPTTAQLPVSNYYMWTVKPKPGETEALPLKDQKWTRIPVVKKDEIDHVLPW